MAKKNKAVASLFTAALITSSIAAPAAFAAQETQVTGVTIDTTVLGFVKGDTAKDTYSFAVKVVNDKTVAGTLLVTVGETEPVEVEIDEGKSAVNVAAAIVAALNENEDDSAPTFVATVGTSDNKNVVILTAVDGDKNVVANGLTVKVADKEDAKPVDKAALTAAIEAVKYVEVSTNGEDIAKDAKWTTEAAKTTLAAAVTAAQTVVEKAEATAEEVSGAVKTLAAAVAAYEAAQKEGTKEDVKPVDKAALTEAIKAVKYVATSTDGKDIAKDAKWTTEEAKTTLAAAVKAAQTVADNTDATAEEVSGAVKTLAAAVAAYEEAQKDGTKEDVKPVDKAALTEAIATASEAKTEGKTEGKTEAAKKALEEAITKAEEVEKKKDATTDEYEKAIEDLNKAVKAFKNAQPAPTPASDEIEVGNKVGKVTADGEITIDGKPATEEEYFDLLLASLFQ